MLWENDALALSHQWMDKSQPLSKARQAADVSEAVLGELKLHEWTMGLALVRSGLELISPNVA